MQKKEKFSDYGRKGDKSNVVIFGDKERIPSVRIAEDMKEVILDKEWVKKNEMQPLYFMYRDLAKNDEDARKIRRVNLRFDILDSTILSLGKEYNKTAGHYHSMVPKTNFTYPELYELIKGEVYYLIQKAKGDKAVDVYAVRVRSGDKVIVPSGYGHFSIFLSEKIRESNWTSNSSISDYESVKQKQGAAYFALIDKKEKYGVRWVKNENYSYVPPLRFLAPTNFEDIGLKKNVNMYNLVKNLEKLDYLNNPQNYLELWKRVLNNKNH